MNREIKFRLWDGKQMFDKIEGFGDPINDKSTVCLSIYYDNWACGELMQYTGLKDKNGKEIYEGDLIRGMFDFGPAGFRELMLPVCWHNIQGYQWDYWNLSPIEVAGNKFEHKELLNKLI